MSQKAILYDLGVAAGAIALWFYPADLIRAAGYTVSLFFSGRAYYTGVCALSHERRNDEKEAIIYEAETDFYDQLLGTNIEAALEIKALEVENRMLARMIPLMNQKSQLEQQLRNIEPVHPELTEQERAEAAKNAIESAFEADSSTSQPPPITEEKIRESFPESLDNTTWKAILKGLQSGCTKDEILRDILGCSDQSKPVGNAYFELLKHKYLN